MENKLQEFQLAIWNGKIRTDSLRHRHSFSDDHLNSQLIKILPSIKIDNNEQVHCSGFIDEHV